MNKLKTNDFLGVMIGGVTVALPVFVMVFASHRGNHGLHAILAGGSALVGMCLAASLWLMLGREPRNRVLKEQPALAFSCVGLFIIALIPTIVWS